MSQGLNSDSQFFQKAFSKYDGRRISKNRPLLYQGEIPTMAFFVKKGVVKVFNITGEGEEKTVGYERDGAFLPMEWLFGYSPVAIYYYDTFTDCELCRVSKEEVIELINDNHPAALSLLERSFSMFISSTMHLHALEQSKARIKLLHILQYLVLRFGQPMGKNRSKIKLRLTHQDIANLIGTTRETVSSEMGKLMKEKVAAVEKGEYVVDTDKSLRLLGETDFNNLEL